MNIGFPSYIQPNIYQEIEKLKQEIIYLKQKIQELENTNKTTYKKMTHIICYEHRSVLFFLQKYFFYVIINMYIISIYER